VLFWGATHKARIAEHMLMKDLGEFDLTLFDPTLSEPAYETERQFVHSVESLAAKIPEMTHFLTCVGGTRGLDRFKISSFLRDCGLTAVGLRHPTAYVDETAEVGAGIQVMPMSVIHAFARVGDFTILNTGSIVEHDCRIGNGVHVMPGATLTGAARVDDFASIGSNATILPGIHIGQGAIVGAGAVVTSDVANGTVVVGVPARPVGLIAAGFKELSTTQLSCLRSALVNKTSGSAL